MFGFIDDIVDVATEVVGEVTEVVTLGLIPSDEAKKLAKAGFTVAEIASELDITTLAVRKLLED